MRKTVVMLVPLLFAATSVCSILEADDADIQSARTDFSERISELGQNWLHAGSLTPSAFRQTAALLRAASREDPREARYPRLLATAMEQLHDVDGQIDAWTVYRRLNPEDRTAQLRIIELYASKMQTEDQKLEYLKDLLGKSTLPDEVRAQIAAMCVEALLERSRDEAVAMVEQGLKIYPAPDLINAKYFLVWKSAAPAERVHGLLALLKANPVQPQVTEALAHEFAAAGMPDAALEWFGETLGLNNRLAQPSTPQFLTDYASELYLAGQTAAAAQFVEKLLDSDRENASFMFLNLTLEQAQNDQIALTQSLAITRENLARRWSRLNDIIQDRPSAPANPADPDAAARAPDPAPALARVKQLQDEKLTRAFVATLTDLAWFELFYANQPQSAQTWIKPLQEVVPADSPLLHRLLGWYDLDTGKGDAAKEDLSQAEPSDVLAGLGLVKLTAADTMATRDQLRKLLVRQPTGLEAAEINQLFRSVQPAASQPAGSQPAAPATQPSTRPDSLESPNTAALRAELERFPKPWLLLIDQPMRIYSIKAEPVQATVRFAEAMYARITLTNRSDYDLVIGYHGPLQPHLWIDANVKGITQQEYPATAYDQIINTFVLRAHGSTSQIVRIDQGALGEAVRQRANGSMVISPTVLTNPTSFGPNAVGPGAAGQVVPFTRGFIRLPTDVQSGSAQRQLETSLRSGGASEKMLSLDLLGAFIEGLDRETNPAVRDLADRYLNDIASAAQDGNPEVSAWANYLSATLPGKAGSRDIVSRMIASHDWKTRLLALASVRHQAVDFRKQTAAALINDPDADVKLLAEATAQSADEAVPATGPVAPATQPAAAAPSARP